MTATTQGERNGTHVYETKQNQRKEKKNNKTMPIFKTRTEEKKIQRAVVRTGKERTELPASSKVNISLKLGFNRC